jgi:MFS family permease
VRRILALAALNLLVLGALTAPAVAGLPIRIAEIVGVEHRTDALAAVMVCGAIGASVGNPLFGFLSDRSRARFGRRPWLVVGVVGGALGCAGVLLSPNVPTIAASWAFAQFAYNATLAAAAGLLADGVSETARASASGIFGAATFLGTLPALVLVAVFPERIAIIMLVVPIVTLVATTILAILIREGARTGVAAPGSVRAPAPRRTVVLFSLLAAQRFTMQLAFSLLASFTVYFIAQRFAVSVTDAAPVSSLTTALGGAGIVVSALVVGFLSARGGRYGPVVVLAAVGLAAGACIRAFTTAPLGLWASAAVAGVALGAFYAVDLAAALRIAPPESAGRYLGFFNLAETLPQTLSPAIAGAVLAVSGRDVIGGGADDFTTLHLLAAAIAAASLCFVPALAPVLRRSRPIPAESVAPGPR